MTRVSGARRKRLIGLTGGIASGKSTAADILEEAGCCVARSDDMARTALQRPEVQDTLRAWWGERVFAPDGAVDRSAVAQIVFNDPAERLGLERLIHPIVEAERMALFERASGDTVAFVIDAPLLVEAGLDAECDTVIFIDAPRECRLARVASRGWDEAELDAREQSQIPLDRKRSRADYVIENDAGLPAFRERIIDVLHQVLQHSPDESPE